jgi:DNA replication protein DnaC
MKVALFDRMGAYQVRREKSEKTYCMRNTKLILIEGIPGSGKSTLAQFIARTLTQQGIACQWWYEEEKAHPLYVFHDLASLQKTIEALNDGRYREVIEAALEKWKLFEDNGARTAGWQS